MITGAVSTSILLFCASALQTQCEPLLFSSSFSFAAVLLPSFPRLSALESEKTSLLFALQTVKFSVLWQARSGLVSVKVGTVSRRTNAIDPPVGGEAGLGSS